MGELGITEDEIRGLAMVAKILRVSVGTVKIMIKHDGLPVRKRGRARNATVVVKRSELRAWYEQYCRVGHARQAARATLAHT